MKQTRIGCIQTHSLLRCNCPNQLLFSRNAAKPVNYHFLRRYTIHLNSKFHISSGQLTFASTTNNIQSSTAEDQQADQPWPLLLEFTKLDATGRSQPMLNNPSFRTSLKNALLNAIKHPYTPAAWNPATPDILLGVLSSDVRLAVRSLRDYCKALKIPFIPPESRVPGIKAAPMITGGVFIKYNLQSRSCYTTMYDGRDRGVLVTLGKVQVGHLPLGLFDEEMKELPPSM
jgi:hypothetical protein